MNFQILTWPFLAYPHLSWHEKDPRAPFGTTAISICNLKAVMPSMVYRINIYEYNTSFNGIEYEYTEMFFLN